MSETITWVRVTRLKVEAHLPKDIRVSVTNSYGEWFWDLMLDYTPNRNRGADFIGRAETEDQAKDAALRAAGLVQQIQAIEVEGDA